VLIALLVLFSALAPSFLTTNNMTILAKHVAISAILAIGMTFVVLAGGIDLSVGSVAGLKGIVITGLDGSPDAIAAIRSGALRATSLQPAVLIARLAVDEASRYLRSGSTGNPERQIILCDLVTRKNADDYSNFEKVR
jgi:ribose/xylose/arabinose/galactoside ABC-type transport system permease subunit